MKQKAFDVMLNGVRINTVFFRKGATAEQVRNELINRQMYDSAISVIELG